MTTLNQTEEDRKEIEGNLNRIAELRESRAPLQPFLSLKETQQAALYSMTSQRKKLKIKRLNEIIQQIYKISEDFQTWRKQD